MTLDFRIYQLLPLLISNSLFNMLLPYTDVSFIWSTGIKRVILAFIAALLLGILLMINKKSDELIKNEILNNEIANNLLKKETLEKELINLYGGNISFNEIAKQITDNNLKEQNIGIGTVENSPSVILARQQIEINTLEKENIKAEYLPSIDLDAKWGQITPQEKFLADKREHQIALNISIPLFSGFSTDAKFQQAVIESTQNKRELRQAEIEIESKKDLDLRKIELSKKILSSLERSLTQALKYKELTISEYKRGIKNSPDVISASDKKLTIERKMLETKTELANSNYSFNETFKPYQGE